MGIAAKHEKFYMGHSGFSFAEYPVACYVDEGEENPP
jgi:hypothetical protein